jgi:hypothetical protein
VSHFGGERTEVPAGWLDSYCASKALCVHHGADTPTTSSDPQCPGCRSAVHAECGYFRRNAGNKWESVTCFMCFKHHGRALRAVTGHTHSKQKADKSKADTSLVKQKPDGSSPEESSKPKADKSEAEKRSKPKADESEADNDNPDENRLHEDPRRVGPSDFTRGQRPSGFSSVIKSHSTTPPKWKKRKYDKALDNQNPSNVYPLGRLARSTISNYETKWWLDNKDEEKPTVTPANDHLAKRPVKTHIFSREETGAFAEENTLTRKMISWILLNRPWPLNQAFRWRRLMQNRRKEPFHSDCSYRPYPTATKSW